jgi:hypothetical protein
MTIFSHAITFPEWVTAYLLRGKRHYDSGELDNLSDRSLEDIGLEGDLRAWRANCLAYPPARADAYRHGRRWPRAARWAAGSKKSIPAMSSGSNPREALARRKPHNGNGGVPWL